MDEKTDCKTRGRPREFDMEQALERAIDVFRQRGYSATSIADLAEGMHLSRGSLYKAFQDKQSVFIAAYDRYARNGSLRLEAVAQGAGSGRERIEAILMLYAKLSQGDEGRRGCLVVATAIELSVAEPDIARRVIATWQSTGRLLSRLLEQAEQDGSISPLEDRAATTSALLCFMQGMRLIGKSEIVGGAAINRIARQAIRLLD
jgi:TetR/AcrR family transcriptional repressor of nem operon